MEIKTGATHYMQFPHNVTGLRRGDFTYYVYQDGALRRDIPVEVTEEVSGIYTFSFTNDGAHESHWTMIVWQTSDTDRKYGESWIVRDDVPRKTVLNIQSELKSGGSSGVSGSAGISIGRS